MSENDYAYQKVENGSQLAGIIERRFSSPRSSESLKVFTTYFIISKDNIYTTFAPWMTYINSVLYDSVSKFIHEANEHGFVIHFDRSYTELKKELTAEPSKLTLFMLSAGFQVWLGSVAIACIVFILEQIVYRLNMKQFHKSVVSLKKRTRSFKVSKRSILMNSQKVKKKLVKFVESTKHKFKLDSKSKQTKQTAT